MLIHTIVLIHDCTLVYCGAREHNWKNEDFFKEELNRSWIEPKSFWRKIGQRYGITDNSQNYRKPKIFEFLKLEFLNNAGEKPKRKSYIFIKEKRQNKICVLKHTWVSWTLSGYTTGFWKSRELNYYTSFLGILRVVRRPKLHFKWKTDFSSRLFCVGSSIFWLCNKDYWYLYFE